MTIQLYENTLSSIDITSNNKFLTDIFLSLLYLGTPVTEANDWIKKAIKHPNKLRKDLNLSPKDKIYSLDPKVLIDYAKKSIDNKRRVYFLRTLLWFRSGIRTPREVKFWNELNKGLEDLKYQ